MKKRPLKALPLAFLVIAWAMSIIWIRHATVKLSYQVGAQQKELMTLREEILRAKSELEQLQSPTRLEKLAKENFQFGPPKREQVITIQE